MDDDFFKRSYDEPEVERGGRRDNLFWWTVLILLLIGATLASWLGSFYVFGQPEKPFSYRWLKKLGKVEAPERFELTEAPPGKFLTGKLLYEKYAVLKPLELEQENAKLLRAYIKNYQETKQLVPYVIGRFNILDTYELSGKDMFPSGVVAVAQSEEMPKVLIEHIYTADQKTVPLLQNMLATGLDIRLARTLDLSAVIHIDKLRDGRIKLTVVPLLYGSYALKRGAGGFSLEPPPDLNMDAGVPVVSAEALREAEQAYAEYRKEKRPDASALRMPELATATASPTPDSPELVRVESTPEPIATAATPAPAPSATPALVAMNEPRATPVPAPPAVPATPTPPPVAPGGVPLKPFLGSAPVPNAATAGGGSWTTYEPGRMPRGRLLDMPAAAEMAGNAVGGEKLYLQGDFVVTAAGESRVVLRTSLALAGGGAQSVRVFVEYPAGAVAPEEGATLSRGAQRPFQITDIRRGPDGTINVYAREVTTD